MLSFIALSALLAGSCARKEEARSIDLVTFPLRGRIVAVDTAARTLTVAHEAIPDYMTAMTMPFKVKERNLLRGLGAGDTITATLAVSRIESWLEGIAVTGKGVPERTLSAGEIITAHIVRTGEMFPDASLLNQDGRSIRFADFRGKVLALTFIYTRCPLPDFCIRMSSHFARVQKVLASEPALRGKWHLISVSFDPVFDRPARLRRYAATYGADLATWDFATDADTAGGTVRQIADGLGLMYDDDQGLIAHNLRTVLIDPRGALLRVINGNEWLPDDFAAEMKRSMP
jgi:protein SCO1